MLSILYALASFGKWVPDEREAENNLADRRKREELECRKRATGFIPVDGERETSLKLAT